jgi:hypothetical protein
MQKVQEGGSQTWPYLLPIRFPVWSLFIHLSGKMVKREQTGMQTGNKIGPGSTDTIVQRTWVVFAK